MLFYDNRSLGQRPFEVKVVNLMIAYEFSTKVTDRGEVIIPHPYRKTLNKRTPVRVILLVEEAAEVGADSPSGVDELSLEQVVEKIQQTGPTSTNIAPASGLLGQHLSELMAERDATFNLTEWQQEWEQIESTMESEETAHEQAEWGIDQP